MRDSAGTKASAPKRGPDQSAWVGGFVLAILIGLTAWVVSWVSIWWVPCYLALMGLIFVKPDDWRMARRVAGPANDITGSEDSGAHASGRSASRDRGEGPIDHRSADDPDTVTLLDGATETLGSEMDSDGAALDVAKPRRGRGRGRKSAKAADATASGIAPATWIRVGPGKFVRADASDLSPNVDHAESQDFATSDVRLADETEAMHLPIDEPGRSEIPVTDEALNLDETAYAMPVSEVPLTTDTLAGVTEALDLMPNADTAPFWDVPADMASAPIETVEVMVSETEPEFSAELSAVAHVTTTEEPGLPELDLVGISTPEAVTSARAPSTSTPGAEEYGIAPSAFSTDGEEGSCDDDVDLSESGELAEAAGDSELADDFDPDVYASDEAEEPAEFSEDFGADSEQEFYRGRLSVWPGGVSRWTVNAVAAVSGASSRRNIRGGGKPVNRKGRRPAIDRGLLYAARGGLRHGEHVKHTWRPRSPPWGG